MEITLLLILGLCAACCVIPMFFMGKKKDKGPPENGDSGHDKM